MARLFPDVARVIPAENPSYLNSVWLGVSVPIIYAPSLLWRGLIKPISIAVYKTLLGLIALPVYGLLGRLVSYDDLLDKFPELKRMDELLTVPK